VIVDDAPDLSAEAVLTGGARSLERDAFPFGMLLRAIF
jgi:hypothetical protein